MAAPHAAAQLWQMEHCLLRVETGVCSAHRLCRSSGEELSTAGFADKDWMIATVPGTVLTSYLNDGAIPDPDFGDNQYAISDSFFCADFWYRDEFNVAGGAASG